MDTMTNFQGFDITNSALRAEMMRAEVVAANLANMNRVGSADNEPYRRRSVIFEELLNNEQRNGIQGSEDIASGVQLSRIYRDEATPFKKLSMPGHPEADGDGMVLAPNVDLYSEMVDLAVIERSFQANLAAMRVYRNLLQTTIQNFR